MICTDEDLRELSIHAKKDSDAVVLSPDLFLALIARLEAAEKVCDLAEFLQGTLYMMRQAIAPTVAGMEARTPVFQEGVERLIDAMAAWRKAAGK